MGQEFRRKLARELWLVLSCEASGELTSKVAYSYGWQVHVATDGMPYFISIQVSLQGCLNIPMMQWLASPGASNPRQQGRNHSVS